MIRFIDQMKVHFGVEAIDMRTPIEVEQTYYAEAKALPTLTECRTGRN